MNIDQIIASIRYSISERADGQTVLWHDAEPIMIGGYDEIERAYFDSLSAQERDALDMAAELAADDAAADMAERRLSYGAFAPECY